jgi:LysM repeat protein
MQNWKILVWSVVMFGAFSKVNAQKVNYNTRALKYIEQFRELAIEEQKRSGVPAAITLAQGIHETSGGQSELAENANNHFGIKCKKDWKGETYSYTDDAPDECFRKYVAAEESYRDHSDYLKSSPRYASLFSLSKTDYTGWAYGLKRCGYATNPKYASLLIKLIKDYNLQDYTYAALGQKSNPYESARKSFTGKDAFAGEVVPDEDAKPAVTPVTPRIEEPSYPQKKNKIVVSYGDTIKKTKLPAQPVISEQAGTLPTGEAGKVNGLRAFYARKGTVLLNDAFKYNIRYAKLLEINDLVDAPIEADMYIYLEKKNTKGTHETHTVQPGESLIQVAQAEGIQLKWLKFYNHIGANEEPMEGAVLQLQNYTENKPATAAKSIAPREEFISIPSPVHAIAAAPVENKQAVEEKAKEIVQPEEIAVAKEESAETETIALQDSSIEVPIVAAENEHISPKAIAAEQQAEESLKPAENVKTDPVVVSKEEVAKTEESQPAHPVEESNTTQKDIINPSVIEQPKNIAAEPVENKTEIPSSNTEKTAEPIPAEEIATNKNIEPLQPVKNTPVAETVKAVPQQPVAISKPVNIANETSIEEQMRKEAEPKDEFSKLKQQLDKVVYSSDNTTKELEFAKPDSTKAETEVVEPANGSTKMYTVKKGDTVFSIAKKHNITMRQLQEWNKLDFQAVKPGQQLVVKQ